MQKGTVTVVLDGQFGSSGKGKLSTWLADHYHHRNVSSANFPNAGHTALLDDGVKFVAKALPTAAILKNVNCWVTPGSGFSWEQLGKEWEECDRPTVYIHERACVMTPEHAARERSGADSTNHIASTMQGTAAALTDKILRRENAPLARTYDLREVAQLLEDHNVIHSAELFYGKVMVVEAQHFRNFVHDVLEGQNFLHEGSQGYALSIDHGFAYPYCTSRNCTTAAALDYLGVAPQRLGDVWLNLRTFMIRVGNTVGGYSGDVYGDSHEVSWDDVAKQAGMPPDVAAGLSERERTTVTKRVRRVFTFSMKNVVDAVRTNGATKISLNFVSYLNWADQGVRDVGLLSKETLQFAESIEDACNIPVVLFGTGAAHSEVAVREKYL